MTVSENKEKINQGCLGSLFNKRCVFLSLFTPPKMRALCVFAVLASLALVATGEEGARLLASKSLLNRYAVEGRDLTLQYNIYNVGTRYGSREVTNFYIDYSQSGN